MPGTFAIGRIFGIRIEINYSWLIILVLLTASLALGWFPAVFPFWSTTAYWIVAIISAVLLFASVLAHELAHSLVARLRHIAVSSITLFVFGGVSNIEQEPRNAGAEFEIAVVGPITSLVIGGICWAIGLAVAPVNAYVAAVLGYLAISNVLLGIFNLIPGFPLDGGRVLRAILWAATGSLQRATRWAARVGQVVAFLFILWGIWQLFAGNFLGGIWIGFIGWFLLNAAQAANTQVMVDALLRGVLVRDVMNRSPFAVPADLTIQQLVEGHFLPNGTRTALVVEDGALRGLVALRDVREAPREQWASTPVAAIMIPRERLHAVRPWQPLNEVLPLMARYDVNQLPVVSGDQPGDQPGDRPGDHLEGLICRDAIMRFLEGRRNLDHAAAAPLTPRDLPKAS